ncbi:MAG: hypothetical protein WC774_03035, partial [Candidatus Gracilibacteria bacterium]
MNTSDNDPLDFGGIVLNFDMVSPSVPTGGSGQKIILPTEAETPKIILSPILREPVIVDISSTKTRIGDVGVSDMNTLRFREDMIGDVPITERIDSYGLFERVQRLVWSTLEKAKIDSTFDESLQVSERTLSENIRHITRLKVNLWIFDCLVNGSGEFVTKENTGTIAENGDKIHFPIWNQDIIPSYINLQGQICEETKHDSWSPIIALYGKAKSPLLLNKHYYQIMGTDPDDFSILMTEGRMKELVASFDEKQLHRLTTLLAQGLGYKNEILHAKRTRRKIAWNSFGNEKSGSIRIGKDITNGVHPLVPVTEFEGVTLQTEKSMCMFLDSIEPVIQKMSGVSAQVTRTWLRALLACAGAVDMF